MINFNVSPRPAVATLETNHLVNADLNAVVHDGIKYIVLLCSLMFLWKIDDLSR